MGLQISVTNDTADVVTGEVTRANGAVLKGWQFTLSPGKRFVKALQTGALSGTSKYKLELKALDASGASRRASRLLQDSRKRNTDLLVSRIFRYALPPLQDDWFQEAKRRLLRLERRLSELQSALVALLIQMKTYVHQSYQMADAISALFQDGFGSHELVGALSQTSGAFAALARNTSFPEKKILQLAVSRVEDTLRQIKRCKDQVASRERSHGELESLKAAFVAMAEQRDDAISAALEGHGDPAGPALAAAATELKKRLRILHAIVEKKHDHFVRLNDRAEHSLVELWSVSKRSSWVILNGFLDFQRGVATGLVRSLQESDEALGEAQAEIRATALDQIATSVPLIADGPFAVLHARHNPKRPAPEEKIGSGKKTSQSHSRKRSSAIAIPRPDADRKCRMLHLGADAMRFIHGLLKRYPGRHKDVTDTDPASSPDVAHIGVEREVTVSSGDQEFITMSSSPSTPPIHSHKAAKLLGVSRSETPPRGEDAAIKLTPQPPDEPPPQDTLPQARSARQLEITELMETGAATAQRTEDKSSDPLAPFTDTGLDINYPAIHTIMRAPEPPSTSHLTALSSKTHSKVDGKKHRRMHSASAPVPNPPGRADRGSLDGALRRIATRPRGRARSGTTNAGQ